MGAVGDIQTIINDAGVFWPTQTVYDSLNEAQLAVYAETKWAITTQSMTLSSGVDIVPIPSNILVPRWIEGTNTLYNPPVVKRFYVTTMRNLETFLRTWRGDNVGEPQYFIVWDSTHWRVFPRPDGMGPGSGGVYQFTVFGIGFPTEIATTTATIAGDKNYVYAVYHYACSLLLEATRPDLADMYMGQAVEKMLTVKKRLRNQQSHNIRTLKPATTAYEIQQGGQINETPTYYPVEC